MGVFRRAGRRLWRVSLPLLLSGMTLGLPTTVLPSLQEEAFGKPFLVVGIATGFKGVLNAIMGPIVGALSDAGTGRKSWLVAMLSLQAFPFIVTVIVTQVTGEPTSPPVVWAFTISDALLGASSPAMSICFAAVPQELGVEEDALTMGSSLLIFALSTGVGIGAVSGAVCGAWLWGWLGLAVTAMNVLTTLVVFPSGGVRHQGSNHESDRIGLWIGISALLHSNPILMLVALIVLLDFLAEQMLVSLLLLYLESRFRMSSLALGAELALVGTVASASLLLVVPYLQPMIGATRLLRVALVANAVSIGLFAFVQDAWQAFLPPLGCLLGFAIFPAANAVASVAVPLAQQGTAQGIILGSRTLAEGVSPVLFGWMFEVLRGTSFPGAPFLIAAGCIVLAFVVSIGLSAPNPSIAGSTHEEAKPGTCLASSLMLPEETDAACVRPRALIE